MNQHCIRILENKINGCWEPRQLYFGGNPLKGHHLNDDFVSLFSQSYNIDINDLRIRRIMRLEEFIEIHHVLKNVDCIVKLAPKISENDEIHFTDGSLIMEDGVWANKETLFFDKETDQ